MLKRPLNAPRARVSGGVVRLWPIAVSVVLAVAVYLVGVNPLAAIAIALVLSVLAYRYRLVALVALLVSVLLPQLLQMIDYLAPDWDVIAGGARFSDLVLVGMWGACAAMLLERRTRTTSERILAGASLLLAGLFIAAVARNWSAFGLSALGEFRFRYLIMGLPVFMALGLDAQGTRSTVARLLAWSPVVGVILTLPIIGMSKGWGVGEASRFYPSAISLALLYGAIWIGLSLQNPDQPVWPGLAHASFLLVAVVLIADGHRSVWLVAAVTFALLVWLGAVRLSRIWSWGLLALAGLVAAVAIIGLSGLSVFDYVTERGSAFVNPTGDPTSNWRLEVWKAYIPVWLSTPLFGQGFGGYWDVYVAGFGTRITTMPHSLYIQTLVKLGLVGMAALAGWFVIAWRTLLVPARQGDGPVPALALMGLIAVAGQLAYGTVYVLEFWNLAWIGVGLASALRDGDSQEAPNGQASSGGGG